MKTELFPSFLIFASMLGFLTYIGVMEYHGKDPFFQAGIEPTPTEVLSKEIPSPIPTKTPTKSPVNYANNIQPTIDPDPIIDCIFDHVAPQKMRVSECQQTFECEIDKWYVYTDKEKCKSDQRSYFGTYSPPNYDNQTGRIDTGIEDIMRRYNEDRQKTLDQFNRNVQEVSDREYETGFNPPSYVVPTTIQINVPEPTCIPLPGGDYSICDGNKLVQ